MKPILRKRIIIFAFIVYTALLLYWVLFDGGFGRTGFDGLSGATIETYKEALRTKGNFLPFGTIVRFFKGYFVWHTLSFKAFAINIFGNILVFVPFGFFLPAIFKKQRKYLWFLLTMTAVITCIEALQLLLLTGSPDVDDLILNLLGASVGYLFTRIILKNCAVFE